MVSTLRITSVFAVVVAGLLVALVAGPRSVLPELLAKFAVGNDQEIDRIREAPSVVDMVRASQGSQSKTGSNATSPLVSQAEAFARILNPPKPITRPSTRPGQTPTTRPTIIKPVPTSSKFVLVGTSFLASDPESSFAYIRLPDKTYQWVRKGDEVGHQIVKEIKHGAIVYWDGHSDVEMAVEAVPETGSMLEGGLAAAVPAEPDKAPAPSDARRPSSGRITGRPAPRPWSRGSADPALEKAKRDNMNELVERLRKAKEAGTATDKKTAEIQKLISDYKKEYQPSRVSTEEAEKLDDLGREMNESTKTPPGSPRVNLNRKLSVPRAPKK